MIWAFTTCKKFNKCKFSKTCYYYCSAASSFELKTKVSAEKVILSTVGRPLSAEWYQS